LTDSGRAIVRRGR
jgi:Transposase DDE domain group 1